MADTGTRPPALKHEIGLFGATALGIGAIIGSGIFIITGIVAGVFRPRTVRFHPYLRRNGGFLGHERCRTGRISPGRRRDLCLCPEPHLTVCRVDRRLDPDLFQHLCRGGSRTGICPLFCRHLPGSPVKIIAIVLCFVFIVINYVGLRESVLFNNLLVAAKVLILLFFVAFGLGFFSPGNFTPLAPEDRSGSSVLRPSSFLPTPALPGLLSWPKK